MTKKEMDITKGQISAAEQVLRDNGIADDEVQTVLQAIGYTLCNTELYPEEPSERTVEGHGVKVISESGLKRMFQN